MGRTITYIQKMKIKDFITADLYLASAISVMLKTYPSFSIENNRTLFSFPFTDDVYKAVNAYNSGAPVNVYEFSQMIKRIRAEMLMRRNIENGKPS